MKIFKLVVLFLLISLEGFSQISYDYYLVEFTDKNESPFSIDQPEAYLSERAIARRNKFGINITEQDFPVNPQYVQQVKAIGVKIVQPCKWFNSIVIKTSDSEKLAQVMALPFVKKVLRNEEGVKKTEEIVISKPTQQSLAREGSSLEYGEAFSQIAMLKGIGLHENGYKGQGMSIAVLDGGFTRTNFMKVFDSLRANNQIKGTLNLVGGGTYVYQGHVHGSYVLSILAANSPGIMIGTAPKADYYLIRTEDTNGESLLEEYNWVTGAEYADSAGVDLISSSLSYLLSSEPNTGLTYEQLDGKTAPAAIAADIASSKGMVVVVSAGNNGENVNWPWVGFPGDADSALTIGATDAHGIRSQFSSIGPTYDGRIKPDVMARGEGTIMMQTDDVIGSGDGTSFATPLIAGLTACLWQANPDLRNTEILSVIKMSSTQFDNPNQLMGYGIPDFSLAMSMLSSNALVTGEDNVPKLTSFVFEKIGTVQLPVNATEVDMGLFDLNGNLVYEKKSIELNTENEIKLENFPKLSNGFYLLQINSENHIFTKKIIKL